MHFSESREKNNYFSRVSTQRVDFLLYFASFRETIANLFEKKTSHRHVSYSCAFRCAFFRRKRKKWLFFTSFQATNGFSIVFCIVSRHNHRFLRSAHSKNELPTWLGFITAEKHSSAVPSLRRKSKRRLAAREETPRRLKWNAPINRHVWTFIIPLWGMIAFFRRRETTARNGGPLRSLISYRSYEAIWPKQVPWKSFTVYRNRTLRFVIYSSIFTFNASVSWLYIVARISYRGVL